VNSEAPNAIGPERSVLSVLLKSSEKIEEIPHITSEHFYSPAHRLLFETISARVDAGLEVELVALTQHLHDKGLLDEVGGPAAIGELYTYAPNGAHFISHARILTEKLTLRRARKLAADIEEALDEGKEPEDVAELAATGSTIVSDTLSEAKPASDTAALLRAAAMRWEALATGNEEAAGMQTSLAEMNHNFRGLKPRRVTVISALPSQGKTLLGGQLFMDCVSEGHRGLFLTWEMTEDELIDRFLAYAAHKPINAVTDPLRYSKEIWGKDKPTEFERQSMAASFRKVMGMPLKIEGMHGQNITQAVAAIRREHRRAPLKIVVMDFVQQIMPSRAMERQSTERGLADIATRFQNLSQELGFHGIILSQLNKDGAAKHAEAINESCALHLKIVKIPEKGKDGTPVMDGDEVKIKAEGIAVVKDRFHGQKDRLLKIRLNPGTQRFEQHNY